MSIDQQDGRNDHVSDPARVPGDGWVDEGGASHLGPATHTRLSNIEDAEDNTESESESEPESEPDNSEEE